LEKIAQIIKAWCIFLCNRRGVNIDGKSIHIAFDSSLSIKFGASPADQKTRYYYLALNGLKQVKLLFIR
jgi:hypothetical protein